MAPASAKRLAAARRLVKPLHASPLLSPRALAAASVSVDSATFSKSSTARESARVCRDWTQRSVYSADILASASRTPHRPPPHQTSPSDELSSFGNSGDGGGAEVVAERLRGVSPPAGWLVRVMWYSDAHLFEERARRTGGAAAQIHEFLNDRRFRSLRSTRSRRTRLFRALSTCSGWSRRRPQPHFQPPAQRLRALHRSSLRRLWRSRSASSASPSGRTCPLRTARNCSHSSAGTTTRSASL